MLEIITVETDSELAEEAFQALAGLVSQERRDRVARFRFRQDVVNAMVGEAIARDAISAGAGIDPAALVISPDRYGKPHAENISGVHFNLSHSGSMVVFAISDVPVGVDVEIVKQARLSVAKRFFCDDEYELVASGLADQDEAFFNIWTMKESYLKWEGKGLVGALDSFSVFEIMRKGRPVFHRVDVRHGVCCHACADASNVSSHKHYKLGDYLSLRDRF